MDVTRTLLYMTCLCLARDLVSCDEYEETGKDITLTPSIRGHPAEILWKINGNKVLEYDGSEVVEYGSFRGRVVVDFETGQLTIKKLNSQDSGQYQCDVVINGIIQTSSYTVKVLDALPDPQVTCEPYESSNASKKLLCSVGSQTQPSFEWSGPNINVQSGPELLVKEQEENRDSVYTCTVKNQANSKSADFILKDCPIGKAGSTVLVPVVIIIIIILLIPLILLPILIYRRKKLNQARLSEPDPENGEELLKKNPTDVIAGSYDATLPSHNRLPPQKESIANKKWERDNGSENSGEEQKLLKETLKETLLEQNLKQSPQSVSEANQEGHEGELDKNEKNSESAVEAEENLYTEHDETEKESHASLQRQEEENIQKQESSDGGKSPEHQNERLEEQKTEVNEHNLTGEAMDTGKGQILLRNEENTYNKPDETEKESHESLQSQEEEDKGRIPRQKQESGDGEKSPEHPNKKLEEQKTEDNNEDNLKGETMDTATALGEGQILRNEESTYSKPDETEKESHESLLSQEEEKIQKQESSDEENSPEHQNEKLEEQKTEDNEDNQTVEMIDRGDTETETASQQSDVTEGKNTDTENEEGQLHENNKSQIDDGEQSPEQQNENKLKTEDDREDDMRTGEKHERSDEENHDGIDRANTDQPCSGPAVNQPLDGEAPCAPADLPANLEKEPINCSVSSSNQTYLSNYTHQDKEEEGKRPGPEPDERKQEQMPEEKDHDLEISVGKQDFDEQDKQADPDCTRNSASQRDEAVKSDMPDKDLMDDHAKGVEGEAEGQTQQDDDGDGEQREQDKSSRN